MHIKNNNISDISGDFEKFFKSFDDLQYIIVYDIVTFVCSEQDNFLVNDLSMIMEAVIPSEQKVSGIISKISYSQIQEEVARCFSYVSEKGILYTVESSNKVTLRRTQTFWELIEKHFCLPPTVCYQHHSESGGYFDLGIMWEFCFILLNEQKQGIILYVGASD